MNSLHFPDVNVWVALHHRVHFHHRTALAWYESLGEGRQLAFCRQTQMGFFRLLTTEAVMGEETVSQSECWRIYQTWIESGRGILRPEPGALETAFAARTMAPCASPKEWNDAYLAAFAELGGMRLVTFDKALAGKARGSLLLS